jgi:hypothetical protein
MKSINNNKYNFNLLIYYYGKFYQHIFQDMYTHYLEEIELLQKIKIKNKTKNNIYTYIFICLYITYYFLLIIIIFFIYLFFFVHVYC